MDPRPLVHREEPSREWLNRTARSAVVSGRTIIAGSAPASSGATGKQLTPVPPLEGFWAKIGDPNPTGNHDQDNDHPEWYQWREVQLGSTHGDSEFKEEDGRNTDWLPPEDDQKNSMGRMSGLLQDPNDSTKKIIINRAREASGCGTIKKGTIVWLTPVGMYYHGVTDPDGETAPAFIGESLCTEYVFSLSPRFVLAKITGRATTSFDSRPYYQWKEQEFIVDPNDTNNCIIREKSGGLSSTIDGNGYVTNPAMEYTRFDYVPTGQVVMLEDTGLKVSLPTSGDKAAAGRVYGFYQPYKEIHLLGTLQADLNSGDEAARVKLTRIDGTQGETISVANLLNDSGTYGDTVICQHEYRDSQAYSFFIIAVRKTLQTFVTGSSYDYGTGALTLQTIQAAVGKTSSSSSVTALTVVPPGSDLPRINTTVSLSATTATIVYGQSVTFTAVVTKASGTADPTGVVLFRMVGVGGTPLGAAIMSGTTATLTVNLAPDSSSVDIYAEYQGDSSFNSSESDPATMTINPASTTTSLSVASGTSGVIYGDAVTLVASVAVTSPGSGSPSDGYMVFKDGSATLATIWGGSLAEYTLITHAIKAGSSRSLSAEFTPFTGHGYKYSGSTGTAYLTVAKAHLTITANDQTRKYGDANNFTAKFDGFRNSETASSALTGSVAITSAADVTSDVNTYAISVAAGTLAADNYDWPSGYLHNGTLTITHASISCQADSKSMAAGGTLPAFTGTITGILNSDAITASYACSGDGSTEGSYAIVPTLAGSKLGNYTQALKSGTLTVSP